MIDHEERLVMSDTFCANMDVSDDDVLCQDWRPQLLFSGWKCVNVEYLVQTQRLICR